MLKKIIINLLCAIFPYSKTRKKIRASLKKNLYKREIICIAANGRTRNVKNFKGININAQCDDYKIIIHEPCCFSNCYFTMRKKSVIEIFESKYSINNLHISTGNNSIVKIDKDFSCGGCLIECHDESGLGVNVGSECMFSYGINIRTSDGHSIYDVNSKAILNKPKQNITIGNHVWLGMHSKILKEVNLPDNTIVGAGTIVTKGFNKTNTVIAGMPAKVIKENINWDRKNTDSYENNIYM